MMTRGDAPEVQVVGKEDTLCSRRRSRAAHRPAVGHVAVEPVLQLLHVARHKLQHATRHQRTDVRAVGRRSAHIQLMQARRQPAEVEVLVKDIVLAASPSVQPFAVCLVIVKPVFQLSGLARCQLEHTTCDQRSLVRPVGCRSTHVQAMQPRRQASHIQGIVIQKGVAATQLTVEAQALILVVVEPVFQLRSPACGELHHIFRHHAARRLP